MKQRNKILIIIGLVAVVLAVIGLIVGFALSGADVLGWFGSKWAILMYIIFGCYALIVGYIIVSDKIRGM